MEIIVNRIAKKKTYTIGHLYLLKEDEVESRQSFSKHLEDKREFRDTFDRSLLDKEHYFCDTLEPTWRNLLGITLSPGEVDARRGRVSGKIARKVRGKTAIPEGTYPLLVTDRKSVV